MRTDSSKNDILYLYLKVLSRCYSTGYFDELFPLLSEDAVMESQWVLQPNTGKAAVMDYYTNKGRAFRNSNSCPNCSIIRLIGSMNTMKNVRINVNGTETFGSLGLLYDDGKYAMYMSQTVNDVTNGVVVDLSLDDNDMISRIDLCMPQLFNFEVVTDDDEGG